MDTMPMRVGIDLVSVASVRESIERHAAHYLERLYTEAELRDCQTAGGVAPERLAARFAAKEAALKVLRPEDEAIPWHTIEVLRNPSGWVELLLSGRAAKLAAEEGLSNFALSISHEAGYATAVVIAELDLRNRRSDPMMKP
jgi:holo-[acyl-carrier protein] synthase